MMPGTKEVLDLFQKVLQQERGNHLCLCLPVKDALKLIQENRVNIDYNNTTYRYAYIYYFAVCHTLTVTLQANSMSREKAAAFHGFMGYQKEILNICSIGGGPGCDLIGLLRARDELGQTRQINCTVVDGFSGWQHSLKYLLTAYLSSSEGKQYNERLKFELVRADLLSSSIRHAALEKVENADIVTLVNFVSDIPQEKRADVLTALFRSVKSGAYVFVSDYANGTFHGIVAVAAKEAEFNRIYQGNVRESISRGDLPCIGPVEIGVPPLRQTHSSFVVWKKQRRYRVRSQ